LNDREALEEELADLRADMALYHSELAALPVDDAQEDVQDRRERLQWQLRREEKRIGEIEERLAKGA
jgi:hypothetical protein